MASFRRSILDHPWSVITLLVAFVGVFGFALASGPADDNDPYYAVILVAFFVALCAFVVLAGLAGSRRWREFGRATGLAESVDSPATRSWGFSHPAFTGLVGRRAARLFRRVEGHGKQQTTWIVLDVEVPEADRSFTLEVRREGLGDRIVKRLGGQDVETGDAAFDRRFRVKASDEARARAVLDIFVRERILTLRHFGILAFENAVLSHARAVGLGFHLQSHLSPEEVREELESLAAIGEAVARATNAAARRNA